MIADGILERAHGEVVYVRANPKTYESMARILATSRPLGIAIKREKGTAHAIFIFIFTTYWHGHYQEMVGEVEREDVTRPSTS